ncbi:ribonuclease P protein subunit p20-like [Daphnia pulex]|uniref:ribonuclease P protein subunit p20-like n=1 Tax=Daphnia pulex TaxID=6669 RepID=UPI001EDE642F|nr:ribonuclease P protein subunit p20-like [Daphnia pulex]
MSEGTNDSATGVRQEQVPNSKKIRYDPEEYKLRKRLPARLPSRSNDVYVNNKTDFKAQLARCFKCLETESSVHIHGLGAAAPKAINLALQIQLKSNTPLELSVNTSTVHLIDDFEPQYDSGDFYSKERQNSAVIIKVYKLLNMDMNGK